MQEESARARGQFGLHALMSAWGDGNDEYGNTSAQVDFNDVTPSMKIAANFYGTTSNAITTTIRNPWLRRQFRVKDFHERLRM